MNIMKMKERRITLQRIAELAGVSKAAVSGALNNSKTIRLNEQTRTRILNLVEEYDYSPQSAARELSTNRSYRIGFLVSAKVTLGLANSYFSSLLASAQSICQSRGYLCCVSTYDLSSIDYFVMPEKIKQRSIDGLIVSGTIDNEIVSKIGQYEIPCYCMTDIADKDMEFENFLCPPINWKERFYIEINYLKSLGHRKIAIEVINSNKNLMSENWLKKADPLIEFDPIRQIATDNFEYGGQLGRQWVAENKKKRFTAIIANDQLITGFLFAIQASGLRVPNDISLIANETVLCEWCYPGITAINSQSRIMMEHGTSILIDLIEKKINCLMARKKIKELYLPPELIIRKTTGKAPK